MGVRAGDGGPGGGVRRNGLVPVVREQPNDGLPTGIVAEAVGHASLAMQRNYTHIQRSHLKALVTELPVPKERQA